MGAYINVGNEAFKRALNSEYVDKTALIAEINSSLCTERMCSCVSRCRRFGKSMAVGMLTAYYDQSCDSHELFRGLSIEKHPSFEKHLNKYPVIRIDMTSFITKYGHDNDIVTTMQRDIMADVLEAYPGVSAGERDDLMDILLKIAVQTGKRFIILIDEWDAICREFNKHEEAMDEYVLLLRRLFKGDNTSRVFAGVYMTGILPIKKYPTESALNNFWEYSMILPGRIAAHLGFTQDEVRALCEKYDMRFDDLETWYDGYRIGDVRHIFNPSSVMKAVYEGRCRSYWAATGAFSSISHYISMNFEGLRDDVVSMLAGNRCHVNCSSFGNDPSVLNSCDEVLTLLIHLGYLAYDEDERECYIPNKEVGEEMRNAVEANNWREVIDAITASKRLLEDLLAGDEEAVAAGVEKAHQENASILKYNDENSLSCALSLALYAAREKYVVVREMPAGRGFADLVLIPRRGVDSPVIVAELKWKQDADTAIAQIKRQKYPDSLRGYQGNVLMCGISYNKEDKRHVCRIEKG